MKFWVKILEAGFYIHSQKYTQIHLTKTAHSRAEKILILNGYVIHG